MGDTGFIFLVCGGLLGLAGHIMMLVAAHERGPGWLLWCFLVPPVVWFLILTDFRRFWKPCAVSAGGLSLILLAWALPG